MQVEMIIMNWFLKIRSESETLLQEFSDNMDGNSDVHHFVEDAFFWPSLDITTIMLLYYVLGRQLF